MRLKDSSILRLVLRAAVLVAQLSPVPYRREQEMNVAAASPAVSASSSKQ
jgi:hypothetical protein